MSLFQFKWLRRFIRKNTNPIPVKKAGYMKQRLSFLYMIIAWNAFGFVCYTVYIGRGDWAKYHGLKSEIDENLSPAQQWVQHLGLGPTKVYRYSGFTKTQEYEIDNGNIKKTEQSTADEEIS